MKQCVILGACLDGFPKNANALIQSNAYLICADGGIQAAKQLSLSPNLIVGDFDSWPESSPAPEGGSVLDGAEVIRLSAEKDETDTQYAVEEALRRGYRSFLILGGLGGRLDHTLANIATLEYLKDQNADGLLADDRHRVRIGRNETVLFDGFEGAALSIFPQGGGACVVSGTGVRYKLEHLRLSSGFPLGVSNHITAPQCRVTVEEGTALFIVCREKLFF